uniref:Serpin domain-containing protein n=1 Tax=Sciurus vulgaris TaxID=55149 RepID=A0A8D2AXY9_SCIVU
MSSLSAANAKFTLDLLPHLGEAAGNVFYSPVSITSALAMLYLGAKGNTARQIEKVGVGSPRALLIIKLAMHELLLIPSFFLHFSKEYLDGLKKFYLANVESLDFRNAPEESRKKINSWVESQTNGKIKDLFPSDTLGADTVLVLVNAVYFKGQWDHAFNKEHTTEAKFQLNKNVSKSVQMMRKSSYFHFALLEDVQAKILEIPYKGKDLSMIVLLPNEADGLQKLEDKLTAEKLMEWSSLDRMKMTYVDLCFPRFKVEESYNLEAVLGALGMEDVFRPLKADLSGMTGSQGLSVSKAVHKSFVEVNEEGTQAAAASGIVIEVTSSPVRESFCCDHPFLFFILQKKTNSILFFGRVSSPEA